jgi:methylaspartate ammonia-lyase
MDKMIFKGVRLPKNILNLVESLLELNGLTFSEYVRNLILQDLDKRSVFSTQLKTKLERTNAEEERNE